MKLSRCSALAAIVGLAATAHAAPPALVLTGQLYNDISADGNTIAGAFFDQALQEVIVCNFTRGSGLLNTGAIQNNGSVRCSSDGQSLTFAAYDLENVGGLDTTRLTPHLWTDATGEQNLGVAPGTFTCDAFTCTPNDISGNGRYIVGDRYTTKVCGPLRPFVYDTVTHAWTTLPTVANSRVAGAIASNDDCTVICGRDDANPAQLQFESCPVVWVKNGATWTRTVLDPRGGRVNAVSADGNTLVGVMHPDTMFENFGTYVTTPIRWTRSGATWTPHNLGGDSTMVPASVSADGSTIVGNGGPDDTGFIWRPTLNGGVPMTLWECYTSLGGVLPADVSISSYFNHPVYAVSADGNAILISLLNQQNLCLTWYPSAVMYLNGTTCEPPTFVNQPPSHYNIDGPVVEPYGMTFNANIVGSLDMTIQWQRETFAGSGEWADLSDDNCEEYLPEYFNYRGTNTMQLRLGGLDNVWAGRYRCVASNACGAATTREFRVTTCLADLTCDLTVDLADFFQFFNAFDQSTSEADLTDDGVVDLADFFEFFNHFDASC